MLSSSELLPSKPQARLQLCFLPRADSSLTFLQQFADKDDIFFQILKNINLRDSWTGSFAFNDRMQISYLALNCHIFYMVFSLCFNFLACKKIVRFYWCADHASFTLYFLLKGKNVHLQNWNLISRFLEKFHILQFTANTYKSLKWEI